MDGRFISPPEAIYRIQQNTLAWVWPPVKRLAVHDQNTEGIIMQVQNTK